MAHKAPFTRLLARGFVGIILTCMAFGAQAQEVSEPLYALDDPAADMRPPADNKVRVAILLPLSGPQQQIGQLLLDAASLALIDAYDARLVLLPFDTAGNPDTAAEAAAAAVDAGANIVLGPLLAGNIRAAGPIVNSAGLTMIGFSNDYTAAAPGRFVMGFQPEDEVRRILNFASSQGSERFAGLFPFGAYGDRVQAAFGDVTLGQGSTVTAMERYELDAEALFEPVRVLADYDRRKKFRDDEIAFLRSLEDDMTDAIARKLEPFETIDGAPFEAILVPEGGDLLRTLAPLLPFYEIDPADVRFLGTGLMNDPALINEPPLQGAWFAAPTPEPVEALLDRLEDATGMRPPLLATVAYDAMALIAWQVRQEGGIEALGSPETFMTPAGYQGVTGLFRFDERGVIERALAVVQIDRKGMQIIDPAPEEFRGFARRATRGFSAADDSAAEDPFSSDTDGADRQPDDLN